MAWKVICEPGGQNKDGKTQTGLVVYLVDNVSRKHEVTRVGFVRKHTSEPDKDFKSALKEVVEDAKVAADLMNKLQKNAGKLQ